MPDFGIMRGFGEKLFSDKLYAGQLPTKLGLIGSQSIFDADAQAFFDRVTTAGGTLTTTEKNALNQLVLDMKSAGIWTSMKAVYPMVGASAAACAQNLKSSSFTGTFSNGWTFSSSGITPNGTNAFVNTGLNQSANLINTSLHCSYYVNGGTFATGSGEIGLFATTSTWLLLRSTGLFFNQADGDSSSATSTSSNGFYLGSRTSNSLRKGYFNGSTVRSSTSSANALENLNYYFGALNAAGSASFFSSLRTAFVSIGDGLTDTQASNFYTAVQAFQTTLSRNV